MPEDRLYQGPIYVKRSPVHGYGVFAAEDLGADELIEECHSLLFFKNEDPLSNYSFSWNKNKAAIPLGYACIYNHSETPNVRYENDLERDLTIFKTLRAIRKGEELFSSYGNHWFDVRELKPKANSWWRQAWHQGGAVVLRASLIIAGLFTCILGLRYLAL